MNARKTLAVFAVVALMGASSAFAAVNNVNSRGQFVRMGTNAAARHSHARSAYRAQTSHAYVQAPAVVAAPAPSVAAAPTEGRRFSYAPSTSAPVAAAAPATDGVRRYSYAPEATMPVASAPMATHAYAHHHSYATRSSGNAELWRLPKTDPRKYGR